MFGDIGGRFVRVQRTQDNAFIVRRNGVGAGTVNGRSLGSGDDIKPAAFAEEFADGAISIVSGIPRPMPWGVLVTKRLSSTARRRGWISFM